MSELNSFGYEDGLSGNQGSPPARQPGKPYSEPYRFSPDEMRVLRECNQESFFQRSLPLATAMGLTTMLAIQKGYLKGNPRFGVVPKVSLAVIVGYFVGKLSYQEKCAQKLMQLPGSFLGQLLRERKEGKMSSLSPSQTPTMFGAGPGDIYSDAGPGSSLNLDTDRPLFNDDSFRPGSDIATSTPAAAPEAESTSPALTYDELRRRNRAQSVNTKVDPYKYEPSNIPPPPRRSPQDTEEQKYRPRTNKYGDIMD